MHEGYECSKLLVLSVHQSFSVYLAASVFKICHFMSPAVTMVDSYWTWCVIAREREREREREQKTHWFLLFTISDKTSLTTKVVPGMINTLISMALATPSTLHT